MTATRTFGEPLLSVSNISLSFGGVKALTDISFDILKGEIRAIIGPNGAGKSSMLNVINGFYHPQEGEVWFDGEKRGALRPHQIAQQGIARTFQNIALFKGMSTLDNIMSGRSLKMHKNFLTQMFYYGPARDEEIEHRRKVEEIIDFLEIAHIRRQPVGKLPYGLQKRVELGRALALEPDLLLLDEPMAGMNLEEKEDMSRFIIDVNQQFGTTIALIAQRCKMFSQFPRDKFCSGFGPCGINKLIQLALPFFGRLSKPNTRDLHFIWLISLQVQSMLGSFVANR